MKNKWVFGFVYQKPDKKEWINEMSKIKQWKYLTKLEDYPNHVFICVFRRN